ncbi:hypothetical protein D6779_06650 [Candidatus Parcubacteria bacterium]|nr:MAG: hypothetical protein D6779_06650 [Candidatus Parcubacteria bacterium]
MLALRELPAYRNIAGAGGRLTLDGLEALYAEREIGGKNVRRTIARDLQKLNNVFGLKESREGELSLAASFSKPVCENMLQFWLDWLDRNHRSRDHVLEMMIAAMLEIIRKKEVDVEQLAGSLRDRFRKSVRRDARNAVRNLINHPLVDSILPLYQDEPEDDADQDGGVLALDLSLNPAALNRDLSIDNTCINLAKPGASTDAEGTKILNLLRSQSRHFGEIQAIAAAVRKSRPCRINGKPARLERLDFSPLSNTILLTFADDQGSQTIVLDDEINIHNNG